MPPDLSVEVALLKEINCFLPQNIHPKSELSGFPETANYFGYYVKTRPRIYIGKSIMPALCVRHQCNFTPNHIQPSFLSQI